MKRAGIPSHNRAREGTILVDLIHEVKPKRILEIGTFIEYSTIMMGKELGSEAEIITIEIDEEEAEIARKNIKMAINALNYREESP